jgi:NTE family protein
MGEPVARPTIPPPTDPGEPEDLRGKTVGLVLAGGGARGAYELGVLSVLLPRLEEEGYGRPKIIVGTSVGAINTAYLAATADDPRMQDAVDEGCEIWRNMGWGNALKSVWWPKPLRQSVFDAFHVPWSHSWSLLDPAPLRETLRCGHLTDKFPTGLPFERIHDNVQAGHLRTAAVAATRAYTSQSVIFCDSSDAELPPLNKRRGIRYEPAELGLEHVLASAAIPSFFPAQEVTSPDRLAGWYHDGGTRLNTPINPAVDLGVELLIIVALHSYNLGAGQRASACERPETIDGAAQLIQAVLIDPLINDVYTLVKINKLVRVAGAGVSERTIPYILIAPQHPDEIAEIATCCFKDNYTGPHNIGRRGRSVGVLGGLLDVGDNAVRGELLSYLMFDKDFANELIKLGKRNADEWLQKEHDNGPWRTGLPP